MNFIKKNWVIGCFLVIVIITWADNLQLKDLLNGQSNQIVNLQSSLASTTKAYNSDESKISVTSDCFKEANSKYSASINTVSQFAPDQYSMIYQAGSETITLAKDLELCNENLIIGNSGQINTQSN